MHSALAACSSFHCNMTVGILVPPGQYFIHGCPDRAVGATPAESKATNQDDFQSKRDTYRCKSDFTFVLMFFNVCWFLEMITSCCIC